MLNEENERKSVDICNTWLLTLPFFLINLFPNKHICFILLQEFCDLITQKLLFGKNDTQRTEEPATMGDRNFPCKD